MKRPSLLGVVALVLATAALVQSYRAQTVRADGIPTMDPLHYAGTLEESGRPVDGLRMVAITLWSDATSMASTAIACRTVAAGTMVSGGRFRVVLDAACSAAVRANPDLWLEVEVNGTSLGRSKVAATPYAIEAARASELTPAARNALVPPGTVIAFAGDVSRVPAGWLACDGRAVSQTAYASLFSAIGTAHGNGGGMPGMFNLPDYRGRFLRGVDQGTSRDPDRATRTAASAGGNAGDLVGSLEAPATASPVTAFAVSTDGAHVHGTQNHLSMVGHTMAMQYTGGPGGMWDSGTGSAGAHSHRISGGDSETRPANAYVNYLVKY